MSNSKDTGLGSSGKRGFYLALYMHRELMKLFPELDHPENHIVSLIVETAQDLELIVGRARSENH